MSTSKIEMYIFFILLVCYFMWSGTLDLQLWCSSIISHNITSITHNYHTNISSITYKHIYVHTYLQMDGEVVEQDRKLDAVRDMLQRAKRGSRTNLDRVHLSRVNLVDDLLQYV